MAYVPIQSPKWSERDALPQGDQRKIIKAADFDTEFTNIQAEFDSIRSTIPENTHGNVASCYWNPLANPKLVYGYNISDVVSNQDGNQTDIVFINELDGTDTDGAHFAFNLSPVSATGFPTIATITGAQNDRISFLSWHWDNGQWELISPTSMAFSFMCIDMDAGQ
jgi:hypothetical protein